jgi:hypothetical protein
MLTKATADRREYNALAERMPQEALAREELPTRIVP